MILYIKNADFSNANIGQNKNVTITLKTTGANGNKSSVALEKDKSVSSDTVIATGLSLKTGYENLVVTVTMTGTGDVSGWYSNGTVTIPSGTTITGNITITATATKTATGDEPDTPTMYTFTINPTPSTATVTLTATGYAQSGNSITVPSATSVAWSVSKDGYTSQSGTHTVNKTETKNVELVEESGEYESYMGTTAYTDAGYRVQTDTNVTLGWKATHSGTTSAGTDYIPVSTNDLIWISQVAVVNNSLGSGGFYNEGKELVAPLYWGTFGLDQSALSTKKFVTPDNPVTISSVEQEWNCTIKYVKFIAWSAADDSNGLTTTEARIYRNDEIIEPTYVSYIGDEVFSVNKYCLPISNGTVSVTTTGSSSAWATDYIPVNSNQKIWLKYIFTMSDSYSCIGIYDSSRNLIYGVKYSDFGLTMGDKFKTPAEPITISDIVPDGADVSYVRFIAWDTSNGGRSNTEARIYE